MRGRFPGRSWSCLFTSGVGVGVASVVGPEVGSEVGPFVGASVHSSPTEVVIEGGVGNRSRGDGLEVSMATSGVASGVGIGSASGLDAP